MKMSKFRINGYTYVLIAASLWATLGLFYKVLVQWYGLSLIGIVFWRALIAAITLFLILSVSSRRQLIIAKKDAWVFLALGSLGIAGFFAIYIYAISQIGMGVAAILLYTAPVWVALFSVLYLKEYMTIAKITALLMTVMGMMLVGWRYNFGGIQLEIGGMVAGLGAGLGYAAHILLSKTAVQRGYAPWVVNAYGFGIGALILFIFQDSGEIIRIISNWRISIWLIILGLLPTLVGGVAFYSGLRRLPASDASIIATVEPVIASLLGWSVFSEPLYVPQIIGGVLILASVIVIQISGRTAVNVHSHQQTPKNITDQEVGTK